MVAVPADTPVSVPEVDPTEALALLLLHVPPDVRLLREAVPLTHMVPPDRPVMADGSGLTVTVTVPVPTQPPLVVPVIVYVVVDDGLAVTLEPVVADSAVAGDHV
jgi:hypothetical protein